METHTETIEIKYDVTLERTKYYGWWASTYFGNNNIYASAKTPELAKARLRQNILNQLGKQEMPSSPSGIMSI